jgi:hypothetical protein
MKTKIFKTTEELTEFIKEFKERKDKTLDIDYFKLTVVLRARRENRTVNQESDVYIDRELGTIDAITDMKRAENTQRPIETKWMIGKPTTMTKKRSNLSYEK